MKIKKSTLQTSLLIFASFVLIFRPAFIAKFGTIGQISALVPILVLIFLIPFTRLTKNQLFLLITPIYILVLGIFHSINIYHGNYLPVLAGLYSIIFPYVFWTSQNDSRTLPEAPGHPETVRNDPKFAETDAPERPAGPWSAPWAPKMQRTVRPLSSGATALESSIFLQISRRFDQLFFHFPFI